MKVTAVVPSYEPDEKLIQVVDGLLAEGYARDVIRSVQDARKAAGLEVSDHIALKLTVPAGDVAKVEQFRDLVSADTLADSLDVVAGAEGSELAVEVAKA